MYKIIFHTSLTLFQGEVIEALADGYDLVGGPFIDRSGDYCQAVFKPRSRL